MGTSLDNSQMKCLIIYEENLDIKKKISENFTRPKLVCYSSLNASKIRIKLKSFDLNELKNTCEAISIIADETNAVLSGQTSLPMKKKLDLLRFTFTSCKQRL